MRDREGAVVFLKAGVLALALLLASRVLGLVRESALAAGFGSSGLADVAVLMFSLPDWLSAVVAGGALSYVLLPRWAGSDASQVRAQVLRVGAGLLAAGAAMALLLLLLRAPAAALLLPGMPAHASGPAAHGLAWAAVAIPLALLAALGATRLQHGRDFVGMYAASLVVNLVLIAGLAGTAWLVPAWPIAWLGVALVLAMGLRMAWLLWRLRRLAPAPTPAAGPALAMPAASVWAWAVLSASLPLALPFIARSMASAEGEGALATFNYAWKLAELPLVLAIQLVASLALPAIASAHAAVGPGEAEDPQPARAAFALAWALGCACAAALLAGAPAVSAMLFGWGRMDSAALARVAGWGAVAAWGLLPQALAAVSLAVLAARARLRWAALAYAAAVATLLVAAAAGLTGGATLMMLLNALYTFVALVTLLALGPGWRRLLPVRALAAGAAALAAVALAGPALALPRQGAAGLALAVLAALGVLAACALASADLRRALRR